MAYIYQITNDINNKVYIGKTEFSIEKRFKEHCHDAFRERMEKRPLYSAMRKYGIEHFHITLLEETDNPEEREVYWIKEKHSYENGYNATMGGDGKKYIDYDLVVSTYQELRTIKDTAEKLNICCDSVSDILHTRNIPVLTSATIMQEKYGKKVEMYDLQNNFIQSFPSIGAAATFMIENNLTGCKFSGIRQHILEVCTGRRKTAAKYKWKFSEI